MTFKRILVSLCTILICTMMFLSGYCKTATIYSYADSTTDNWTQVTTNAQLVEAFRYYCKSRDLTIDGSIADGVTKFTTKTFNGLCNSLGINITALQAHLKYETDSNIGTRFLFDTVGINAYNRIFAQFLQDNDLSVGDTADEQNNLLYSGKVFIDSNGNSCLCYIRQSGGNVTSGATHLSDIFLNTGTDYYPSMDDVVNLSLPYEQQYNFSSDDTYYVRFNQSVDSSTVRRIQIQYNKNSNGTYANNFTFWDYYKETNINGTESEPIICYYLNDNKYHYAVVQKLYGSDGIFDTYAYRGIHTINMGNVTFPNATVYLTTNNTVINNNIYEGDTIINNYGTPSTPQTPGGGGNTTTPPTNSGGGSGEDDGVITFPDFDFHFPEIDWSLGDLSEKFPFSIPFDLIAFFSVLNATPQAPSIDANIPLGSWYTWHFEADFAQFDNYAVIIRNVEFIGFCVALIYLTIRLVKG